MNAGRRAAASVATHGAYTRFISRIVFPLHERWKRHTTVAVRRDLESSQYWTPQQLQALQLKRLRALLVRAQTQVPYYRAMFLSQGFDAQRDVDSLQALTRLALLDKALIRRHSANLRARDAGALARFNTGGSSGEPLVFYLGKQRVSHDVAAKWRATRWWDVDIGDREAVLWGSPIELGTQDRLRGLRDRVLRTALLPAFDMAPARLDAYLAHIRARRPRMLFGYPSALARMACHAAERGQRMDDLGIRVAFVTAERLYDQQRTQIAGVFGCPVANGYGGRDAGFIAHQCPHGGMHITAEDIIVEIVDATGLAVAHGNAGEIVVTHLASGDFPFIRYRTGDIGVMSASACPCGRGLPMLQDIQGRSTDFLIAADGTAMHGLALIYIMRDMQGLDGFKIIQESLTLTRVQVVARAPLGVALIEAIVCGVQARLGRQVQVTVEQVPAIMAEASGKFRYVVSHV